MVNIYNFAIDNYNVKILDEVFDGIYITDKGANTIYVNKAYQEITGLHKEDLLGVNMKELVKNNIISTSATLKVLKTGKSYTVNQFFNTGKKALVSSKPIFDDSRNIIGVITSVRNLNELIKLKSEANESNNKLDRYKEEFSDIKKKMKESHIIITDEMIDTLFFAKRVSMVDSTVLLLGETGVGK